MSSSLIRVIHPDAHTWDTFVDQHDEGHILQSSRWGQLKALTDWHTHRIGIQADGILMAGVQLLIKRRYGLAVCYVPRGPLLSGDRLANQALIAASNAYARSQRALFVRYEPNCQIDDTNALLYTQALDGATIEQSTTLQPQHSVHTPLPVALADLRAQYSKGHRADIKKAERLQVHVRLAHHAADIDVFTTLMQETGARAGFATHDAAYYRQVWQLFGSVDRVALLIAELDNVAIAGAMVVAGAGQACYLYGGSRAEAFGCGANHLLQMHAMAWAQAHGCHSYDAWGIPYRTDQGDIVVPSDTSMSGLIRFKKGFGGHEVSYLPAYTHVLMPWAYRLLKSRIAL
jgi:lipid II:glycine glycyltransferase (peptidoglycan interpeptide bridge formation enzyme)